MPDIQERPVSPSPTGPRTSTLDGRRKTADGPRKSVACMACRKLKIKCHMPTTSPPCTRCRRRSLTCSVHPSLQTLIGDDLEWKQAVTRKLQWIEAVMKRFGQSLDDDEKIALDNQGSSHTDQQSPPNSIALQGVSLHVPRDIVQNDDITMDVDSGPALIPPFSFNSSSAGRDGIFTGHLFHKGDIIADGIVTEQQAAAFFDDYAGRLDHYLYRILGPSASLVGIRSSSSVLLAAICSVAALHSDSQSELYEPCYRRFADLAANLSLAETANLDDIRGLCIGAFWLHRISWNLSSLAVRIATQKHLHRTFRTAMRGDPSHFTQVRLYFLVYVCDHHFSVAYGRPPLTQDDEAISRSRDLLSLPQATEDDARLISQVELWSITSRVLGAFGFDVEQAPSPFVLSRMRRFAIEYDTWRADWNDRFRRSSHVDNYPRKGVKLHVNFAKLYLCSHALRAPHSSDDSARPLDSYHSTSLPHVEPPASTTTAKTTPASASGYCETGDTEQQQANVDSADLEDMATAAIHSAQNILDTMVADVEIQAHLNGLPVYFHTMIAFSTMFLYKMATQYPQVVGVDRNRTLERLSNVARVLGTVTAKMSAHHLLTCVATAVENLANAKEQGSEDHKQAPETAATRQGSNSITHCGQPAWREQSVTREPAVDTAGLNWGFGSDFDWTTYDFLATDGPFFQAEELQDLGGDQGSAKQI